MRLFHLALAWAMLIGPMAATHAHAEGKIKVVASFSILGDFVRNVGGDRVSVTELVGPNADVHVYTPSPSDAKTVGDAKLMVVNGLGLEGWLPRLVKSAGGAVPTAIATRELHPRKLGPGNRDDVDPHAWQSVPDAKIYVESIRKALTGADPAGASTYRANADQYLVKLDALDREVRELVAQIPPERRKVISTHSAFGYFAATYGIAFVAPQGVSTESEPSARDVAAIITEIRKERIPAVFLENISDPRMVRRIATETGAKIGGTLYSDSLTDEKGDAPTYIDMVRHNIKTLATALKS